MPLFAKPPQSNVPEFTVSEISQKLKRTVEENFSHIRIRGEISRVTIARSGHLYTSLKDDNAVIDAVCWKGTVARLGMQAEEGLEVICTGRLTTYPGSSKYQLVIESMEMAGEGALLKMLEERKKKLAAEGLFDPTRKKPIPFLPEIIGVITSPTGAVIRDILHRLKDRFPRHVMLWPVTVQGENAAKEVVAAIEGFNRIAKNSPQRPDVLIVARGGGSLEDLMPFNEESVVRAAAASDIPLISAIGHETDTTLIDYAADLRAPTPTGAAEMAVPVRAQILAQLLDNERRIVSTAQKRLDYLQTHLQSLGRGLGDPRHILESYTQRLDHTTHRFEQSLRTGIETRLAQLRTLTAGLSAKPILRQIDDRLRFVNQLGQHLQSLSFERVLERGYVLVTDTKGNVVSKAKQTKKDQEIKLRFADDTVDAKVF